MSSYSFEIALFGEFFPKDLKSIMNRIALHSDSAQQMHSREIVFEPLDINQQREQGQEPVLLRARKELLEPDSGWYVSVLSTPMSHIPCQGRHAPAAVLLTVDGIVSGNYTPI